MRDLMSRLHVITALPPAAATADNNVISTGIIPVSGYEGLMFLILLGQLADADATFAVTMEHGDAADLSDAAPVPAKQISGTLALAGFTFADDNKARKVGYVGSKAYVRLKVTPANNTGNTFITIAAVLGYSRFAPTPNPPG